MVAAMKTAPAVMAPQGVESPEPNIKALEDALAAPFEPSEVKWKAQAVSKEGSRALAVAFVDARVVQDRLDDVLGVMGWQDSYEVLPDGAVVCRLRVRLVGLGEWITKEDVGGQSEQPDEGDRRKASFSDALKRAAVKFGIGRYLYRLPQQWADYDPKSRKFLNPPKLPAGSVKSPSPPKGPMDPAVEEWVKFLGEGPTVAILNEECQKRLSPLALPLKQKVWKLIESYAHNQGWAFDTARREFATDPQREGQVA